MDNSSWTLQLHKPVVYHLISIPNLVKKAVVSSNQCYETCAMERKGGPPKNSGDCPLNAQAEYRPKV